MNLTKIERVRLSEQDVINLSKLRKFKVKKSKFIRDAIREKIERELPEIIKVKPQYCPF